MGTPWNPSLAYKNVLSHDDTCSLISIQDGAWHGFELRNAIAHKYLCCTWPPFDCCQECIPWNAARVAVLKTSLKTNSIPPSKSADSIAGTSGWDRLRTWSLHRCNKHQSIKKWPMVPKESHCKMRLNMKSAPRCLAKQSNKIIWMAF